MRKCSPLTNLRRARTLNQDDLARLLGVSQQTLSKFEKGQLVPSVDMQERIAAILGASRADVFPEQVAP
jgi:transcriptional regulator with XRE-family HTH domain